MLSTSAFGVNISSQNNNFEKSNEVEKKEIYNLKLGEPKLSLFPYEVFNNLKEVENINYYYPTHGDEILRQKIIDKYYPFLEVENMAITHGAISSFGQEIAKIFIAQNENYKCRYVLAMYFACSVLNKYSVEYILPEGAFFIMINYQFPDLKIIKELEKIGVLTMAGSTFGSNAEGYIRVSFAQSNDVIRKAFFNLIGNHWLEYKEKMGVC